MEATTHPTLTLKDGAAIAAGPLTSLSINGLLGSRYIQIIDRALFKQVTHQTALVHGLFPALSIILISGIFETFADYLSKEFKEDKDLTAMIIFTVAIVVPIGSSILFGSSVVQAIILTVPSYLVTIGLTCLGKMYEDYK